MNLNHEWTTKGIFSIQFKSKIGFFERVCISIEITNILDNFDLVVDTTIWPQMTNCQWILFENSSSLITIPCLEKKSTKYLIISIPIHVFFDPKSLLLLISCCPLMENQAKLDPNIYSIISSGSNVNLPKSQTTSIEIQKPDEWNKFDWTGLEYLSENSIIEFVQFVVCSFVSRKLAKPIEINEFRQKFAPFVFFDLRSIESQFLAGIDQFFGLAIILSNKQRRWIDVIYAK